MTFKELTKKIQTPLFTLNDVVKMFLYEPQGHLITQLHRMVSRGDLLGIKRGFYMFPGTEVDEFVLASKLYSPSYVSLESALNLYGIIPDIISNVTSVSPVTSKQINAPKGNFLYSKINKKLFFGFEAKLDPKSRLPYNVAIPEKALLDYVYIRKIKNLSEQRVDNSILDREKLLHLLPFYPEWVRKVIDSE